MSHHCPPRLTVPENSDLNHQDVYGVTAVTSSADQATGDVMLALNEDELFHAYTNSCARADGSFDQFMAEVQAEANAGASAVYLEARQFNETHVDATRGVRISWLRVCIKWRWLRIYINWHI